MCSQSGVAGSSSSFNSSLLFIISSSFLFFFATTLGTDSEEDEAIDINSFDGEPIRTAWDDEGKVNLAPPADAGRSSTALAEADSEFLPFCFFDLGSSFSHGSFHTTDLLVLQVVARMGLASFWANWLFFWDDSA